VLGKVAEEEKIEVSEAEIDAEVENMVKGATEKKEELQKLFNSPRSRGSIKQVLLTRKTLEKLTELARSQSGEIVTPAVEAAKPEKREEAKQ
jgi:trigger factor